MALAQAGGPLPSSLPTSLSYPSSFQPRSEAYAAPPSATYDDSFDEGRSPDELANASSSSSTHSGGISLHPSIQQSETRHSHSHEIHTDQGHLSSSMSTRQPLQYQTMDRPRDPFASNSSPSLNGPAQPEGAPYFRGSGEYQHVPSGFTPLQGGHAHLPADDTRSPISQLTNLGELVASLPSVIGPRV